MRLIKCHIENFGALSDYSVEFGEGLTVIKENNGYGKSTLAVFIKAMFYGLPKSRKSSLDENERLKFTPWQGGNFGGSLDFEAKGGLYRIERFFMSGGKDSFKLYDLRIGRESGDYSSSAGVELFGLDAESFERSVYMGQSGPAPEITVGLSAKLTDLVENNNDLCSYDKAMAALKKRRLFYSTQAGSRGAVKDVASEIEQLESRLADCRAAVRDLESVNERLTAKRAEIAALEKKRAKIRELIISASNARAAREAEKRRNELESRLADCEQKLRAVNLKYPSGLPEGELINIQYENLASLSAAEKEIEILSAHTSDNDELAAIDAVFSGGVPTGEDIARQKNECRRAETLRGRAEAVKAQLAAAPFKRGPGGRSVGIMLIAAVLLGIAGTVVMLSGYAAGAAAAAAGVVIAGIAGFIYLKNMILASKGPAADKEELEGRYAELISEIENIENENGRFVLRYFDEAGDVPEKLDRLSAMLRDRERLQKSVSERGERIGECRAAAAELRKQLDGFFSKYSAVPPENYSEGLDAIKEAARTVSETAPKIDEIKKKLEDMPERAAVSDDGPAPEEADRLAAEEKSTALSIDRLRSETASYENRRSSLMTAAESLPETERELENRRITYGEYRRSLEIIDLTMRLLEAARQNLSGRYTDVMTRGFKKYADMITGEDVGDLLVDTDLGLNIERCGSQKAVEYFSAGYRDMFDIAMRLALADALYGEEKPVLILDDPFVNMDDGRVKNALEILKKLAADRQILYLTCHTSRCP